MVVLKTMSMIALLFYGPLTVYAQSPQKPCTMARDSTLDQAMTMAWDHPETAIDLASSAWSRAQAQGNSRGQADALYTLGQAFENLDAYDRALDYYMQALEGFQALDHRPCIAKTFDAIGFIYWYTQDDARALDHYERADSIYTQLADTAGMATIANHRGLVYWRQKQFDEAIAAYNKALYLSGLIGDHQKTLALYNNLGLVYHDMGDYQPALDYFKRALEANKKLGKTWSVIENHNNLGRTYTLIPEYRLARHHLDEARQLAHSIASRYLLADNARHLFRLYQQLGDYRKALQYHKEYQVLQDSLSSGRMHANIAALRSQHKIESKEKEIRLLESEKALSQARLRAHQQWLRYLTALLLVIGAASLLFYWQRRNIERAYNHLVLKNMELVESEKALKAARAASPMPAGEKRCESAGKYSGSTLSEEQKARIKADLDHLMEEEKYYLTHDLTINRVAEALHISRTYLSQVINECHSQSFVNYINGLRVKEAQHLLSEDVSRLYTIEAISSQVGFNSTNVFNKAFKRSTGVTPSFYIRTMQTGGRGQN